MDLKTPARLALLCSFLVLAPTAWPDELRERQLEADVSRLQRELDAQSRRIDALERAVQSASTAKIPANVPQHADESPAWLVPRHWDSVRTGMKELDVLALLGRPTSVRMDADGKVRTLLYALELGPGAILAGNVRMTDAGVTEINRPALR